MSIAEIRQMSKRERLAAMEQLWDSLCHDEQEPDSPEWHRNVLEDRKQKMASPDARFLTLEQLRRRYE